MTSGLKKKYLPPKFLNIRIQLHVILIVLNVEQVHSTNTSRKHPPQTPLLKSKTGVYGGIHYFLVSAQKHRLPWQVGSNEYPQSMHLRRK